MSMAAECICKAASRQNNVQSEAKTWGQHSTAQADVTAASSYSHTSTYAVSTRRLFTQELISTQQVQETDLV